MVRAAATDAKDPEYAKLRERVMTVDPSTNRKSTINFARWPGVRDYSVLRGADESS